MTLTVMKEKDMSEQSRYTDATATVDDLQRLVDQFQRERNWAKYHTPKNLASSVAIEAAELMEHFQWLTPEESYEVKHDPDKKEAIADEIADVASYLLNLCLKLDVDLASEFARKMKKNAIKYPIPAREEAE